MIKSTIIFLVLVNRFMPMMGRLNVKFNKKVFLNICGSLIMETTRKKLHVIIHISYFDSTEICLLHSILLNINIYLWIHIVFTQYVQNKHVNDPFCSKLMIIYNMLICSKIINLYNRSIHLKFIHSTL